MRHTPAVGGALRRLDGLRPLGAARSSALPPGGVSRDPGARGRVDDVVEPFVFVGCVELREILGQRAEDEKELADLLAQVPAGSVYYHTHGFFLRHRV